MENNMQKAHYYYRLLNNTAYRYAHSFVKLNHSYDVKLIVDHLSHLIWFIGLLVLRHEDKLLYCTYLYYRNTM